jgi:CheY-like chemotaxis protein
MKKILVIDDEPALRQDIVDILECLEFIGLEAENGLIGVEVAQKELPDLIICDIMMPELDGYGVLKLLRDYPSTAVIPFIFLSAKADQADIRKGMSLGADDYLTKPFTISDLEEAIVSCLDKQIRRKQALEILFRSEDDRRYSKLVEQEEFLAHFYQQVHLYSDLKTILNSNLMAIRNLLQVHRCGFFSYHGNPSEFVLIKQVVDPTQTDLSQADSLQIVSKLSDMILSLNGLQVDDVSTEDELDPDFQKNLLSQGINSILAVVTQATSGEVGLILCEHCSPRTWTANEIDFLQTILDKLPIAS